MLFGVLQTLSSILPEYQFSLTDFLEMFDSAVPGEFPELYGKFGDCENVSKVFHDIINNQGCYH